MRYMDDGRVFLFPLKAGWRWRQGDLLFCKRWEVEDSQLTPTERTRRVIHGSMVGVESFLRFTMETGEDFNGKWLPTLDTELKVREDNRVLYRFCEKPVATNMTVQFASAMEENNKMKILANDLTRRLLNMSEDMTVEDKVLVIDNYSTKLATSGYSTTQIRRIIVNGIKAYESKIMNAKRRAYRLHRTADESYTTRARKKLTQKTEWYRQRKDKVEKDMVEEDRGKQRSRTIGMRQKDKLAIQAQNRIKKI